MWVDQPGARGLEASPDLLDLLALLDGRRDARDLAHALRARGRWPQASPALALRLVEEALDRLADAGLLAKAEQDVGTPEESADGGGGGEGGYAHPAVHRLMLQDGPRTAAFARALAAVVRPGDAVLDLGTGSGALAVFAARAGAGRVYAVERTQAARLAREVVARNGVDRVVAVHEGDVRDVALPSRVDVLVSEWLGHFALHEGLWPVVVHARDAWLRMGGTLVPARVRLLVAPFEDPLLRARGPAWWDGRPWGLDLGALGAAERARPLALVERIEPGALRATPAVVHTLDCARADASAQTFEAEVSFTVERDALLDGVAGWFEADLAPGVTLDTGPAAPATHWRQLLLQVDPVPVAPGDVVVVRLAAGEPGSWGLPSYALELQVAGKPARAPWARAARFAAG